MIHSMFISMSKKRQAYFKSERGTETGHHTSLSYSP